MIEDLHLLFVKGGMPIYWIDGEKAELSFGEVLFAGRGTRIRLAQDPAHPPEIIAVRFDLYVGNEPCCLEKTPSGVSGVIRPFYPYRFEALFEQLYLCALQGPERTALAATSNLLFSILWSFNKECHSLAATGSPDSTDRRMEDVRLKLENEPEGNWTIAELAASVYLSESYFSRRFKQHTGMTPKRYQLMARMRYARFLLEHEDDTIQSVAARLGYSDPFVFSRQFTKVWGVPPSAVTLS